MSKHRRQPEPNTPAASETTPAVVVPTVTTEPAAMPTPTANVQASQTNPITPPRDAALAAATIAQPAGAVPEPPRMPLPMQEVLNNAESVQVELPKNLEPDRDTYWAGVLPDCPLDTVTAGTIAFTKSTKGLVQNRDTAREEAVVPRDGIIVRLNGSELAEVKRSLLAQGILLTWRKRGPGEPFEAVASVAPLRVGTLAVAWFVWLVKVPTNFIPHAKAYQMPASMALRPADLQKRLTPPKPAKDDNRRPAPAMASSVEMDD